nr:ATP-binding protein [Roseomonas acroporae]
MTACDREPIHRPGSIQPHGHLLAFAGEDLRLTHADAAAGPLLGEPLDDAFGRPFEAVFRGEPMPALRDALRHLPERGTVQLGPCRAGGRLFQAIGHRSPDGYAILELEAGAVDGEAPRFNHETLEGLYPLIRDAFDRLGRADGIEALTAAAAAEVRRITGFDRVLIYRFGPDWDGTVVAEDRNDRLPAYLGLRFPASDIPAQARHLYTLNRQRLIADADYVEVPILAAPALRARFPAGPGDPGPAGGAAAAAATDPALPDLSFSVLRSVSPVHRAYMRNMGTPASMSVSLLRNGTLWGLVSCHHAAPRRVPFAAREACDLIAQMLAVRAAAWEETLYARERARLKGLEGRLLAHMAAAGRFIEGLVTEPDTLCGLTGAAGAAVLFEGHCTLIGRTPAEPAVRRIAAMLEQRGVEQFETASLAQVMPEAASLAERAAGLLAIRISELRPNFVLWFRPELVTTVTWGGDPRKPVQPPADAPPAGTAGRDDAARHDVDWDAAGQDAAGQDAAGQDAAGRGAMGSGGTAAGGAGAGGAAVGAPLGPRHSFAAWQETVRLQAAAWSAAEIDAARDLRSAVISIVLRQAEEMAELTTQLERSNKELAAFSYSVSHDLRAPFRHIVGYSELLRELEAQTLSPTGRRFVATIIESAQTAGALIDALLNFSRMGRSRFAQVPVDTAAVLRDVLRTQPPDIAQRRIEWRIGELPVVAGDPVMLRLVLENLVSNAVKYTRGREPAVIQVGCQATDEEFVFSVRDNGTGFDMAFAHKLFGVFQRLHRAEDFEGIGIGLANVRRIVERHGGRVWAEGQLGLGASFFFTLPRAAPHDRVPPEAEAMPASDQGPQPTSRDEAARSGRASTE